MLEKKDLLALMKTVAKADPSNSVSAYSFNGTNYSYSDLNDTLREELNQYAGSYSLYRENKNLIFSLIEETLSDVLPKRVLDQYGAFAEVKTFNQGDKPVFTQKLGRIRAKSNFITRVGNAGIYEVFKLGEKSIEVKTDAIGGAAQIGLEEFLDGKVDFAELTAIVMDGMDDLIYREIANALIAGIKTLPAVNHVTGTGFDSNIFDKLLATASAYGDPTIYCTFEFATKMFPADASWASDAMKQERWANGYFSTYKGRKVIVLPQSFEDNTNTKKVIDPSYCWIIPNGVDSKPVKIAFEGDTIVDEIANYDRSREIQVYKKVGVATIMAPGICSYQDKSLKPTNEFPGNPSIEG